MEMLGKDWETSASWNSKKNANAETEKKKTENLDELKRVDIS